MLSKKEKKTNAKSCACNQETVEDVRVATARKVKLGGKKMAAVSRRESEKEGETSVISGATHDFARKCNELEGKQDYLNEKLVLRDKSTKMPINGAGFVAFTTDYHMARHHPPKNN